jgi:hypothetical protein
VAATPSVGRVLFSVTRLDGSLALREERGVVAGRRLGGGARAIGLSAFDDVRFAVAFSGGLRQRHAMEERLHEASWES